MHFFVCIYVCMYLLHPSSGCNVTWNSMYLILHIFRALVLYRQILITNYSTTFYISCMFRLKLFSHHQRELFYREEQHVTRH
jgi:hypothetical protein